MVTVGAGLAVDVGLTVGAGVAVGSAGLDAVPLLSQVTEKSSPLVTADGVARLLCAERAQWWVEALYD